MKNQKGFTLIELLVVVTIIGIIAAIAIPALLRAKMSANEASAIGDTRAVISSQTAYQSANGGFFDGELSCLSTPGNGSCLPDYPSDAPNFLDSQVAGLTTKSGYDRSFEKGAAPTTLPTTVSPTSVTAFAYRAVPTTPRRTGVRGFGGDYSGLICTSPNGELVTSDDAGALVVSDTCRVLGN